MEHINKLFGWILIFAVFFSILPIEMSVFDCYKTFCAKKVTERFIADIRTGGIYEDSVFQLNERLKPFDFRAEVNIENKDYSYTQKEIDNLLNREDIDVVKIAADDFITVTINNGELTMRVCSSQIYKK